MADAAERIGGDLTPEMAAKLEQGARDFVAPDHEAFEAWFRSQKRTSTVPGFEHAMFFKWLELGKPDVR